MADWEKKHRHLEVPTPRSPHIFTPPQLQHNTEKLFEFMDDVGNVNQEDTFT